MERILVLYATRQGQAKKIAERAAEQLRSRRGVQVDLLDVARLPAGFGLTEVLGVLLVASVHLGSHEREMVAFVRRQREALARIPTAFLSVSLSQAGADDPQRPREQREASTRDVTSMLERFFSATQFRPRHVKPVAGALMYTRYNPLVRFVMRRIARAGGASTDTSCDHELTDWAGLLTFVDSFGAELVRTRTSESVPLAG